MKKNNLLGSHKKLKHHKGRKAVLLIFCITLWFSPFGGIFGSHSNYALAESNGADTNPLDESILLEEEAVEDDDLIMDDQEDSEDGNEADIETEVQDNDNEENQEEQLPENDVMTQMDDGDDEGAETADELPGKENLVTEKALLLLNEPAFAGGDGTAENPYLIETAEQLNNMRDHLSSHFKLIADINLGVAPYNENDGWEPVGYEGQYFRGSFDGNGKKISNLYINRPTMNHVGLFGYVISGTFSKVHLVDANIIGKNNVGILIGNSYDLISIEQVSTTGKVSGENQVGGLIGYLDGTINNASSSTQVKGEEYVGGLIGRTTSSNGSIKNASAAGEVKGHDYVGGLVGYLNRPISSSFATGIVNGEGNYVGGLIGSLTGNDSLTLKVEDSYAAGVVNGGDYAGGLIGGLSKGNVLRSKAKGNVTSRGDAGGLVGVIYDGLIGKSFATGNVEADVAGGLVGRLYEAGSLENTYAHGDVEGYSEAGGLIGRDQSGQVKNSYATGTVASQKANTGGLIGVVGNNVTITNSYFDKETTNQTDEIGKGIPKTTAEMQIQTTFSNWDFSTVWDMPTNDYPRLKWESIGTPEPTTSLLYVKEGANGNGTSWHDAFGSLQVALDIAKAGDDIWIAKGTYYPTKDIMGEEQPTNERTKTFQMKNNVSIYGGFTGNDDNERLVDRDFVTNETMLSGNLGDVNRKDDNAFHVFYHPSDANLNETALLDGVTISDGNANGQDANRRGGGMYNENSSPTLRNIRFMDNFATEGGGLYNLESSPQLSHMTFHNNEAGHGGGIYNDKSSPTLINVTLSHNRAVSDNRGGGGMMNTNNSHPVLMNVAITDNDANGQYSQGGGIYSLNSGATLIHTTMANNTATKGNVSIYYTENTDFTIRNSIILGSDGALKEGEDVTTKSIKIAHSLIEGAGGSDDWDTSFGTDEGDNIGGHPLFVDEANGDYQLAADSPGIDGGDNNFIINGVTVDLAGNARIDNGTVDMGAYEFVHSPIALGGDVTAIYVDELDVELAPPEIHKGNLGDRYETTEKTITGYTLTATPINEEGVFIADAQEVKYVYQEDEIPSADKKIVRRNYADAHIKTGWQDLQDLYLPDKVEASIEGGKTVELAVKWDRVSDPMYAKNTPGQYRFTGEFVLIDGVINPDNHKVVRIYVLTDAVVNVYHVDETGEALGSSEQLTGPVSSDYKTDAQVISGYVLTEKPDNAEGTFTRNDIDVTYVYKQDVQLPEESGEVIAIYVDKFGTSLAKEEKYSGNVGEPYATEAKTIEGYALTEVPENAVGFFVEEVQRVVYIYVKNAVEEPEKGGNVIVSYVDEDGRDIAPAETYKGDVGEEYRTTAKTIEGYTLTDTPENAEGRFTKEEQKVVYVYKQDSKDPETGGDVIVSYVDEDGRDIAPTETYKGDVGEEYRTTAKTIEGYTLTDKPENAEGRFTKEEQKVVYVYKQEKILIKPEDTNEPDDSTKPSEEESKLTIEQENNSPTELPKTATNNYNLIMIGILLFMMSLGIYIFVKRKEKI